jgi:hypothetical protein
MKQQVKFINSLLIFEGLLKLFTYIFIYFYTGCTKFNKQDLQNIYDWVDKDPFNHHPIIDITSLLGAIDIDLSYLNFFSPPQKVGGGVPGVSLLGMMYMYIKKYIIN